MNERYYQFIIWRELMRSFPLRSRTERQDYDLAFYDETGEFAAVAEIKGWWSDSGETELPGIRRDLRGKLELAGVPGVMMILTSQLTQDAKDNLSWLAGELGLTNCPVATEAFSVPSGSTDEETWEFAVIGFLLTPVRGLATR